MSQTLDLLKDQIKREIEGVPLLFPNASEEELVGEAEYVLYSHMPGQDLLEKMYVEMGAPTQNLTDFEHYIGDLLFLWADESLKKVKRFHKTYGIHGYIVEVTPHSLSTRRNWLLKHQ